MNHKTSHHPIEKLTATIMKHSIVTLVAIGIITIFFALAIPKLKLDANVFSYAAGAPPAEIIQTPAEVPEGTLVLDGIGEIDIKPDKGEVVTVPDRENTFSFFEEVFSVLGKRIAALFLSDRIDGRLTNLGKGIMAKTYPHIAALLSSSIPLIRLGDSSATIADDILYIRRIFL